tara:strand:+ start:1402 stop:2286 length:885 start_codon:yes stop_codon:yes gene_type:complete
MKKIIYFIFTSIFILSCSTNKDNFESEIDFDDVLSDQGMSDSDRIIDLKITLSRQEEEISDLKNDLNYFENAFDSLKTSNNSLISYLESQIDSFKLEQSILIGPEFSSNLIKLDNKVNILEDRAFFMDSLYFSLVTDMVIIENQINSLINSIDEIEYFSKQKKLNNIDSKLIDYAFEYQSAHQLYMSGDYDLSLNKFKFLLNNEISNDLADNCQFWIAQIYFVQNDYLSAVNEFNKVLDYKNSNKSVDSFYKIGLCFIKLNDNQKAINAFQKIIVNYPKSKYFNKANEFILNLK